MSPAKPAAGPKKRPGSSPETPPLPPARPLKPQRTLLLILSVVFALWIAVLIALYFLTPDPVHPL